MNRGDYDALITKAAKYYAALDSRIIIRMFTEFNARNEVVGTNSCGVPLQTAWKHIVDIYKANGANNVGFWFVPAEGINRDCVHRSYPGETEVDWVGSDSYNWCFEGEDDCYSTPYRAGAADFNEVFNYSANHTCPPGQNCLISHLDEFGPRKPFIVGETGSVLNPSSSSFKASYLKSIADFAPAMRHLRGVSMYDTDVAAVEGSRANFHLLASGTPEELEAARYLISAPVFKAGTAPAVS